MTDTAMSFDRAAKTNTVKFNQVGDFILGTLISVTAMSKPDKYGKYSNVYTILTREGKFLGTTKNPKTGKQDLDKEETLIKADEEWTVFAERKSVFDTRLKSIKIGQFLKVELTEIKPSTKGNDAKIKTVFPGLDKKGNVVMNDKWIKEKAEQDKLNSGSDADMDFGPGEDVDPNDVPME
jgi:hypothetical protein